MQNVGNGNPSKNYDTLTTGNGKVDSKIPAETFMAEDAIRTDPKTREIMLNSVLVVEAEYEIAIKKGYLDSVKYCNLWQQFDLKNGLIDLISQFLKTISV